MLRETSLRSYILRALELVALLILFLFAFSLYSHSIAGELHIDKLGITVDSANRNADRIRRYENRKTRHLNTINNSSTGTYYYSTSGYCPTY